VYLGRKLVDHSIRQRRLPDREKASATVSSEFLPKESLPWGACESEFLYLVNGAIAIRFDNSMLPTRRGEKRTDFEAMWCSARRSRGAEGRD